MRKNYSPKKERLSPSWSAVMIGICSLYALWPIKLLHASMVGVPGSNGGYGWFPFLIYAPIVFFGVIAMMAFLLGAMLLRVENTNNRAFICLLLLIIFGFGYGAVGYVGIGVVLMTVISSYLQTKKETEDAKDEKEFFNE